MYSQSVQKKCTMFVSTYVRTYVWMPTCGSDLVTKIFGHIAGQRGVEILIIEANKMHYFSNLFW